jgi:hypothetical protein
MRPSSRLAADRDAVTAYLLAAVPGLDGDGASGVLERAGSAGQGSLRQIAAHLAGHPDPLRTHRRDIPPGLIRLAWRLHAEGHDWVIPPRCAGWGKITAAHRHWSRSVTTFQHNHSALDALRADLRLAIWREPDTHVTYCRRRTTSRRDPAVRCSARRVTLRARETNSARSNICRPPVDPVRRQHPADLHGALDRRCHPAAAGRTHAPAHVGWPARRRRLPAGPGPRLGGRRRRVRTRPVRITRERVPSDRVARTAPGSGDRAQRRREAQLGCIGLGSRRGRRILGL